MPFPLFDGGALSIYNTAMGLVNQDIDVKVFAINTPKCNVDIKKIPNKFRTDTKFEFCKVDTRINFAKAFLNIFSGRSYFVERFYSKRFNAHLIRILKSEKFDIIQIEHLYMCLYLDTLRKHSKAKIILRPQNVESQVWSRFLRNKVNFFKSIYLQMATNRLLIFEKRVTKKVDGIIAISSQDAKILKSFSPNTPLIDIPMGIDYNKIVECNLAQQYANFPMFYHLGSMDWFPNMQGIKWFVSEVFPSVLKKYPDFKLRIAGKKMPDWLYKNQSNNLIIDGEVSDAFKYQENMAIMIVPLLSGGGIRIKIIEGMSLGKTIISTSIGAEGIPYTDKKNILIADNKEEFVKQIGKCFNSKKLCEDIGSEALTLAKQNFDLSNTAKKMIWFYKNLS